MDWVMTHETFLKGIDELEVIQRIKRFRKLNFQDMTYEDISIAISDTLCFNESFSYMPQFINYPLKTKFFRVRQLEGKSLPNKDLHILSDFWNPPENVVLKNGRLNKIGESLLYTSPFDPLVPIREVKLNQGAYYALIIYEARQEVKANLIGGDYNYDKLEITDKKAIIINELYNNFLRDEFSRDVGAGTEFLYRISEIIAKWFFDLPPREVQDAWAYPSVQNKSMNNVCFRPDIAKDILELQGAVIAYANDDDFIHAIAVAHGFTDNGSAQFHAIGSDIQKLYFPEIQ